MSVVHDKQLNILEMLGYRRAHMHKSIDSMSAIDITVPTVDNNLQYDSPTITRVTKQFAENIGRLSKYILENAEALKTTNLATYITTDLSDANGMNKIFVAPPCTMTSQRTLALKNCLDIQSVDIVPSLLTSFMLEDKLTKNKYIVGVSSSQILRMKINATEESYNLHPTVQAIYGVEDDETYIKRAGFADANRLYIYLITNKDIRLFRTIDICNETLGSVEYTNIVDFKNSYSDNHHRYDDNIIIEDIYRKNQILSMITNGKFHEFVDKYYKLGDFPKNVLEKEYYSDDPRIVYDVGIITGKYGIYQIHCYSAKPKNINEFDQDYTEGQTIEDARGSLHIRCLDNKPVNNAFFYEDKGIQYLIALNGWPKSDESYSEALDNKYKGVTVIRLDEAVAASISYKYQLTNDEAESPDWKRVPPNGVISNPLDTDMKNNILQVLDSQGINGAYVNDLQYMVKEKNGVTGFLVKYKNKYYNDPDREATKDNPNVPHDTSCWFVELGDQKLWVATKDYNRHEFNCLSEYKINESAYYTGNNSILFYIKGIGLVEGIKEYDKVGNTGFRFKIVKTEESFGVDEKILSIYVMNRCFVAITKNKIYFVISTGDFNVLQINKDFNTNVKEIQYSCTYEASNEFCIGYNTKNGDAKLAVLYLKYDLNTEQYTDIITQNLSNIISDDFMSKDNYVSKVLDKHVREMHGKDTIIDKLNSIVSRLKNKSIMQATGFTENMHISQIILNYPNNGDDFSYVETDENSTNIYGRLNSKTVNANPTLTTIMKRNSNALTYYDTIQDDEGNVILSSNKLTYSICKLSPRLTRLTVNVPSTGTYYVDNIIGWSCGSRTGSALMRKNLGDGYIQGDIENCTTRYQLVLNRVFFDVKNILNVTAQLTSVPLKIYSNIEEFDIRHYGMYDSPIVAPLNMNSLTTKLDYDMSDITNDEIVLSFSIFGGDAMQINILIENYE